MTIMGHVDHGKTTLLDHMRKSQITLQEFGGITQHIGAFVVPFESHEKEKELVTFLDTPGHAAFASMRKRGANVTDLVVLVIACEDGVLDQTKESIKYAKNADVPMIVAVNKIDKFTDDRDLEDAVNRIRVQLKIEDVITEKDGGDVQLVKISALKGLGVDELKECVLALAETLELKADLEGPVKGRVIESSIDKYRGKICTILVQDGTLKKGSVLMAEQKNWARVRALFDEFDQLKQSCGPGLPIQITGWREDSLPAAGDFIEQASSEAEAKKIIRNYYMELNKEKTLRDQEQASLKADEHKKFYKEKLREKQASGYVYRPIYRLDRGVRPKETGDEHSLGENRKLNVILKCDVDGSMDALLDLLDTYDPHNNQLVKLDIMHFGVGNINESDITLASSFDNSLIYGFNVKADNQQIFLRAKQESVNIKLFNVIYHLIDDLKKQLEDSMPEKERQVVIGQATVVEQFLINEKGKKKLRVAGCRCNKGIMNKDLHYKLMRREQEIACDLQINTLKHVKDDVKEISKGLEFGISFKDQDGDKVEFEFLPSDLIIGYEKQKYKPKLKWDLRGF